MGKATFRLAYNSGVEFLSQSAGLSLALERNEIGHLNNALNEVCNGSPVANFEAAIGLSPEQADNLLHRMHQLSAPGPLNLTLSELDALRNALTAVLAELEPWEYATRMGFQVQESETLRNRMDTLSSEARYGHLRQSA